LVRAIREATMANESKVTGPASCSPSIEKTDGEPIEHWMGVLKDAGLAWRPT